jgi:oligosaccharide repeat unit polymerase
LRALGRCLIGLALAAKLVQAFLQRGLAYGQNQTTYDSRQLLATVAAGFFVAGLVAALAGNLSTTAKPFASTDITLIAAVSLVGLIGLGSRDEAIGAAIVVLLAYARQGTIRPWSLGAAMVSMAALSNVIGNIRVHGPAVGEQRSFVSRVLLDTSSPYLITDNLIQLVPSTHPYSGGATYLQALSMMLPGPISRALHSGELGTGSYVYRDIIGFHNPNNGFGFSFTSEAYLNFGYIGIMALSIIVGAIVAYSYRIWRDRFEPSRASSFSYPIIVSAIPLCLRSDALGTLKLTLYPLIVLWLLMVVARTQRSNAKGTSSRK